MKITEKIAWIVLPSLFLIGFGSLEINFPHAMNGFEDNYTGRGTAGLIILLFEMFLMLTWGKIGGIIAILLGIALAIVISFLLNNEQAEEQSTESLITEDDKSLAIGLSLLALRAGKTYVQRKLRKRQP